MAKSLFVSASANCCCCCFSCISNCCCCSLYCDDADCVANDDCGAMGTGGVAVAVDNKGPTRLPLLLTASNDGVVTVMETVNDDGWVTVDDRVTRPLTPDVSDVFDVLVG